MENNSAADRVYETLPEAAPGTPAKVLGQYVALSNDTLRALRDSGRYITPENLKLVTNGILDCPRTVRAAMRALLDCADDYQERVEGYARRARGHGPDWS